MGSMSGFLTGGPMSWADKEILAICLGLEPQGKVMLGGLSWKELEIPGTEQIKIVWDE